MIYRGCVRFGCLRRLCFEKCFVAVTERLAFPTKIDDERTPLLFDDLVSGTHISAMLACVVPFCKERSREIHTDPDLDS
jgi:hypothetical protein